MLKEIKVNNCENCPFRAIDYDDFSVGYDSMDTCLLAMYNEQEDYLIQVYNINDRFECQGCDEDDDCKCEPKEIVTPKWCPLLGNTINISYG